MYKTARELDATTVFDTFFESLTCVSAIKMFIDIIILRF